MASPYGLLPNSDGRGPDDTKDIASAIINEQADCSEARLQLIRRFAACAVMAEILETKLANGETIDITEHAALTSAMVRVASRIGINRHTKTIGPTLGDLLKRRMSEREAEDIITENHPIRCHGASSGMILILPAIPPCSYSLRPEAAPQPPYYNTVLVKGAAQAAGGSRPIDPEQATGTATC